ncbi:MAG TPA: hypothetical protein G4O04_07740 [Anaerolineae bacterium]|nr:hypothetical protein [Anaerolineae bacterium]HID85490.1 hypothetical protein [Anaerolineales bacterium]HIQ07976.1 hypothetical protein [Anaerolineaceae bacterium]
MHCDRSLSPQDRLVLAADARLGSLSYVDDTIWALSLRDAPTTVVLETTYGLRARHMRLFPLLFADPERRQVMGLSLEDSPFRLTALAPNYAAVQFRPHATAQGRLEWFIPDGRTAMARLSLRNSGPEPLTLYLGWVADLSPGEEGRPMEPWQHHATALLTGETQGLPLLIFLTGGPEGLYSPYPTLVLPLDLVPGQERRLTLVHLVGYEAEAGLETARRLAARPWEAQITRLRLADQAWPRIQPADETQAWALTFARQSALRLLHGPFGEGQHRFALRAREPDQGYSPNGHGSDHPPAWSGLTVPEVWYLSSAFLLPHAPNLAAELLQGFLAHQRPDGWIDAGPGPAGQQAHALASPLLVDLAGRIYAAQPDPAFAAQMFEPLWRFLQVWFAPEQDTDSDGLPEWHHPAQVGLESLPEFSPWHPWSTGADLATVEDPALWALLYRACQVLENLAPPAQRPQAQKPLRAWARRLREAVQQAWDPRRAHPLRWDRDTHLSLPGQRLGQLRGSGAVPLRPCGEASPPIRPVIIVYADAPLRPQVHLRGRDGQGRPLREDLTAPPTWYEGRMVFNATQTYACLESLTVEGLPASARVEVRTPDLTRTDLTLLLPFWAGMLTPAQEQQVLRRLQSPQGYARPYGLPLVPTRRPKAPAWEAVHMLWNLFALEGLEQAGARPLAADLLTRLWQGAGETLQREGYLREAYHARTGKGMGQRNVLLGLPPLSPALRLAGVVSLTPKAIELQAESAFAHPVTLFWRGVRLTVAPQGGTVRFPHGATAPLPPPPARVLLRGAHQP